MTNKLPQKILDQLSSQELKTLQKYISTYLSLQKDMLKYQSEYTQYVRKTKDSTSQKARKLADKGFKYMKKTLDEEKILEKYINTLKKKYT